LEDTYEEYLEAMGNIGECRILTDFLREEDNIRRASCLDPEIWEYSEDERMGTAWEKEGKASMACGNVGFIVLEQFMWESWIYKGLFVR
jgi:hypothetical protein